MFSPRAGGNEKTFPATNVYSVLEESRVYGDEKFKALLGRNETGEKIARIVEEEVKNVWFDPDDGTEKQIRYGDIAVLIRKNAQAESQGIAEAFTLADIPFASSSPLCLDDYPEIKTATDVLSYIDNAAQDVPLCSAMLSPAGKFSCDELSAIRLACRDLLPRNRRICLFASKAVTMPLAKNLSTVICVLCCR